jgi:two-component system LytT family response regulator
MKLSAIIIDDENYNIEILQNLLTEYASDTIEVVATANNTEEAQKTINKLQPQVLFLDIRLDKGTAFDLLLKIEPYNYMAVFATAHKEYVIESFRYNAVYYILKPLSIKDIITSVNLAWKEYHLRNFTNRDKIENLIVSLNKESHNEFLEVMGIPEVGTTKFVKHKNILYCKSDGRYTEIYLNNGDVRVSAKNLGLYEDLLPSSIFFRIHKSFVVNLNMITQISKTDGNYCELSNGDKLPISKRKATQLYSLLQLG